MMEPNGDPIHALLPFYLNGTLEAGEAGRFARHLPACAACREEIELLQGLKEEIERHGEAFFEPHPGADRIVALCLQGIQGPEGEGIRRHLALCPTCAAEARLVREDAIGDDRSAALEVRADRPSGASGRGGADRGADPSARRWRTALPWAIAACALVTAGLSLTFRPAAERATRVVRATYVEQRVRAEGLPRVTVPAGETSFEIVLPVDLDPSSYPVALEIRDGGGRVVFARAGIREAYRDRFLFVDCLRSDFPDGDYVARVAPAASPGAAPPAPIEFAFRVLREAEGG